MKFNSMHTVHEMGTQKVYTNAGESLANMRGFCCARCLKVNVGPMDEVTSVRLGYDAVEVVKELYYLGDVLCMEGDVSSAVTGRIQLGWKKFKEVSGMLCTKHVSLKLKGELYKTCVRSVLGYGAECWALKKEDVKRLQGTEKRMIQMMCGKTLMDKYRSEEPRKQVGVKDMDEYLRDHRLRWFGHMKRRDTENMTKRIAKLVIEGERRQGRPTKRLTYYV